MSSCSLTGVRDESSSILHSTYATLALITRAPLVVRALGELPLSPGPSLYPASLLYNIVW
jgi:hypothetical protein